MVLLRAFIGCVFQLILVKFFIILCFYRSLFIGGGGGGGMYEKMGRFEILATAKWGSCGRLFVIEGGGELKF